MLCAHRDGPATVNGNQGSEPNYHPNTMNGAVADPSARLAPFELSGVVGRYRYQHPNDDFEQAGALYRLQSADARTRLVNNISGHLGKARKDIQERAVVNFYKCVLACVPLHPPLFTVCAGRMRSMARASLRTSALTLPRCSLA